MRGTNARWCGVPMPSYPWPQTVPFARRTEPRRTARHGKWQFPRWNWTSEAIEERRWLRSLVKAFAVIMSKPNNSPVRVAGQPGRLPPVRVKLLRQDAYMAQTRPPDGDSKDWWQRLNKALGTTSSDFVNASLLQLQAAARSPFGTISETHINAALAMVEAAAPKDEIEGALAVQMACTHTAARAVLAKLEGAFTSEQRVIAFGSAAARLMRAYATQVEVLRRLRNGGQQFVRVEHVHVNDGGQAENA